ncbi:dUTPase-like protein [Dinothrombium tinctorium]|uniref:Deoxyuridine 5'-triphosphate nucleotidohydrolase n=1 Tax=Dinothrombium tinctorium TaxID=1965070 RepID=A0A443QJU0_9ACAR|nr:dUTPase-like protein [Dinothrombium tinctorium]
MKDIYSAHDISDDENKYLLFTLSQDCYVDTIIVHLWNKDQRLYDFDVSCGVNENDLEIIESLKMQRGVQIIKFNPSTYDYFVNPKTRILIKTDLQFEFPENCYGRIAPRSSLSSKFSIDIYAGVVDANFHGNVCVVFINNGKKKFVVKKGMRIAEIICEKYESSQIGEVDCLSKTQTNNQGFGSSNL